AITAAAVRTTTAARPALAMARTSDSSRSGTPGCQGRGRARFPFGCRPVALPRKGLRRERATDVAGVPEGVGVVPPLEAVRGAATEHPRGRVDGADSGRVL